MPSKKKNRRKGGKAGGEDDAPPALSGQQADDGGSRIVQDCVRRGYPIADVHACLDFMWNSGMPLDNLDLVLQQLQARSPTKPSPPMVPAAPTSDPPPVSHTPGPTEAAQAAQAHQSNSPGPGVAGPLETVAMNENVENALGALCKWAQVADADQVRLMFDSRALELVLANILRSRAVSDSLASFLDAALASGGAGRNIGSIMVEHINRLLNKVEATNMFMNDAATVLLSQRLASVAKEFYEGSAAAMPSPVDLDLLSNADGQPPMSPTSQDYIPYIFGQRDSQHERLLALQRTCTGDRTGMIQDYSGRDTSSMMPSDDELISSLISSSSGSQTGLPSSLMDRRREVKNYRDHVRVLEEQNNKQTGTLQEELKICLQDIDSLQQRKSALIAELEQVEEEIKSAKPRKDFLEQSLADVLRGHSLDMARLSETGERMQSSIREMDDAEAVVKDVRELEKHMRSEIQRLRLQGSGKGNGKAPGSSVLASYVEAMDAFLKNEAACTSVLEKRLTVNSTKLEQLSREIAEYKALGVVTYAQDLERSAEEMKKFGAEDEHALSVMKGEARHALEAFAEAMNAAQAGTAKTKFSARLKSISRSAATLSISDGVSY